MNKEEISSYKRLEVKQKAVDYLGGKCSNCGYNKCLAALEFHHINPMEKDKDFAKLRLRFNKLKPELDKCILLCANCHREHHSNN
jgi:5-methylcytosine-specific restriction endonuclease McrA